jgi:predicted transcriptional regulator YdeE
MATATVFTFDTCVSGDPQALRAYAQVREGAESGHEVADAPHFERYGDDFDGQAGAGGIEVWLPIGR